MNPRDILANTQALERYMTKHGQELLVFYQQAAGHVVSRVQIYVDPELGQLRADVVMDNGLYLPFVVDVNPDWETDPHPDGLGTMVQEVNGAIMGAATERKRWEG